uniref:Nuclear receptor domain-containing protein n=1 Tax=Panagrellus redivivus TaxID=6233 RepID=A0A7E4V311_PANRE
MSSIATTSSADWLPSECPPMGLSIKRESTDDSRDTDTPPESATATSSGLICVVCGDQATGRHYGSPSCNGCKGFFRRTIRRSYTYTCRFNGNCKIDKHNRAVCRACRYTRCINFGMKVDAVQNERDLIGKRPRMGPSGMSFTNMPAAPTNTAMPTSFGGNNSPTTCDPLMDSTWDSPPNLLDFLLKAENKIKSLRETVIKETSQVEYAARAEPDFSMRNQCRSASVNDIFHSLHSQLLLVIEWAKSLRPFAELNPADQTALLKNFASQHIVLCVAYRSINSADSLRLLNDSMIVRGNGEVAQFPDDYIRRDCERVMDQLVAPMRFMQMDDYEFIALKACVLFNPVARGLSRESVMKVLQTRRKIFTSLEHYVNTKTIKDPHRVGDLTFFILSPLQSLAKSMSEDVLMSKMSGVARIERIMEELILEDSDAKMKSNDPTSPYSETERKLSNPTLTNNTLGTNNAGNYGYDMLSTLSNYMLGPYACSRPMSPSNDPYMVNMPSKPLQTDSEDSPQPHSSSVSPDSNPEFTHPQMPPVAMWQNSFNTSGYGGPTHPMMQNTHFQHPPSLSF